MLKHQLSEIKVLAKIAAFKGDLEGLLRQMEAAPHWKPGTALKVQCREGIRMMDNLCDRLDRKLVVSIIGPCGSGKSTLLNALAGVDDLSPAGIQRPTTQKVAVLCRKRADADLLADELGSENIDILTASQAPMLDQMVLVDTPDTDSTRQALHIPLIQKAIGLSDVLLCAFDAENPKRKDHADFMAPYVRRFHGLSLVTVINKCDRQSEAELTDQILPDFSDYLSSAWNRRLEYLFCISARHHLQSPEWDPQALPRHDFDQFDDLRAVIDNTFRKAGFTLQQRLHNAKQIRDYLYAEVRQEALNSRTPLESAALDIRRSEADALDAAIQALRTDHDRQLLGINVQLYQKLSQRWMGPVGWVIALWARILVFGTGFAALLRFGNPLRQIRGALSALLRYKETQQAVSSAKQGEHSGAALAQYRITLMQNWPDIAEKLVKGSFDPVVRNVNPVLESEKNVAGELSAIWAESMESTLDQTADRLSGMFLQLFFNLPTLCILGYVGWLTARDFFLGHILPYDFFLHAVLTILIILFLTFFMFQGCVKLAGSRNKIHQKVFHRLKERTTPHRSVSSSPMGEEIEAVMRLGGLKSGIDDA